MADEPESDRSLVRRHVGALLEEALERGVPTDSVGRALLYELLELWCAERSLDDVANELRFAIDHLDADDADFPFMRP